MLSPPAPPSLLYLYPHANDDNNILYYPQFGCLAALFHHVLHIYLQITSILLISD